MYSHRNPKATGGLWVLRLSRVVKSMHGHTREMLVEILQKDTNLSLFIQKVHYPVFRFCKNSNYPKK